MQYYDNNNQFSEPYLVETILQKELKNPPTVICFEKFLFTFQKIV